MINMNVEFEDILEVDEKQIELVRNWRNSNKIKKYMYTDHYISKTEHQKWIGKLKTEDTAKAWLIKHDKKPVGLVYLSNINRKDKITEWGIYIADDSVRGKGIGAFSLYKLMKYVFDEMNFNKMHTKALDNNPIAIELYEKLGFKKEGKPKEKLFRDGKHIDVISMGILKEEWDSIKVSNL